jgi:hypothetical protein
MMDLLRMVITIVTYMTEARKFGGVSMTTKCLQLPGNKSKRNVLVD